MKKLLKLTITFITSILLLTACSGEKTKTYINKVNGEENQIIIYYKKDIANKLSLTHIIKNADENIFIRGTNNTTNIEKRYEWGKHLSSILREV